MQCAASEPHKVIAFRAIRMQRAIASNDTSRGLLIASEPTVSVSISWEFERFSIGAVILQ